MLLNETCYNSRLYGMFVFISKDIVFVALKPCPPKSLDLPLVLVSRSLLQPDLNLVKIHLFRMNETGGMLTKNSSVVAGIFDTGYSFGDRSRNFLHK